MVIKLVVVIEVQTLISSLLKNVVETTVKTRGSSGEGGGAKHHQLW